MSRHTPVERLPSGLFFTANFARQRSAVESEEVNPSGGAPKKIVYSEASTTKPSVFAHFSSVTPRGPLPATEDHKSPCSSRSSSIGEPDQAPTSLPLLNVSVEVNVEGFIAHTTLVQRFNNPSDETITQARYTFHLYDGAVVTSFRCSIGNERVLQGKVEPKKEARRKYKEAVEKKEVAALLEEHTPEVFETVVGNIPAKTAVQVNITYVNELKAATGQLLTEGLSVILPTSIAPRYSRGPKKYREANNLKNEGLDITITVHDDDGHVKDIISESGYNIVLEKKAVARPPQVITALDDLGGFSSQKKSSVRDYGIFMAQFQHTRKDLEESMDRFFAKVEAGRYVKRVNWSVTTGVESFAAGRGTTHAHEGEEVSELEDLDVEQTFLQCERQTLHRLPHSQALVFAFKTYLYPIKEYQDCFSLARLTSSSLFGLVC